VDKQRACVVMQPLRIPFVGAAIVRKVDVIAVLMNFFFMTLNKLKLW
jgi:hypothetical protein